MGRRLAQEVVEVVVGMDWTTGSCSVSLSGKGSSCVLCDEEEGAVPLLVLCHPLVCSSL